jgi:hypothetical protein
MHQPWHEDGGLDLAGHWLSGFVRRATPAVWRLGRTSTIDGQNLDVKEPMTVVTKMKINMHQPGIEPGSVPWQGTILPLDHWC